LLAYITAQTFFFAIHKQFAIFNGKEMNSNTLDSMVTETRHQSVFFIIFMQQREDVSVKDEKKLM
jgi:hypothetical protein